MNWEDLDIEALFARREEQTTSAGVGAYPVPLGKPMRRKFPVSAPQYEPVEDNPLDMDYEWAKRQLK